MSTRKTRKGGRARSPLGELLLKKGLVAEEDLEDALREHEETGARLGEVLVGRGLLSESALARALAEQLEEAERSPLGQLLVQKGLIDEDDLEAALEEQARSGRRLGEILVARRVVSGPALTRARSEQLGFELTIERGFGSGLWAAIERRAGRREEEPAPAPAPAPGARSDEEARIALLERRVSELRALLAAAEQELARRLAERDAA